MEIDGVPVVWLPDSLPLRAFLYVRCGPQDEAFRTAGVTALVAHWAVATLPQPCAVTPAVYSWHTRFECTGSSEDVRETLRRLCAALGDLPGQRPPSPPQQGIWFAGTEGDSHTAALLLLIRYGAAGPGLVGWAGTGHDQLTDEQVRAHAAQYFVAGNAALVLVGPLPEDLRLPLPPGPRAVHPGAAVVVPGPAVGYAEDLVRVGVALRVEGDPDSVDLGLSIVCRRLTEHESGLCTSTGLKFVAVGRGSLEFLLEVDGPAHRVTELACLLWETLGAIAEVGPTAAELADELTELDATIADPSSTVLDLRSRVVAELFGLPYCSLAEVRARLATLTQAELSAGVSAGVNQALGSVLVVLPRGAHPGLALDGVPLPIARCCADQDLPTGRAFRRLLRGATAPTLVLTDDGIATSDPTGEIHVLPFAEIVGIQHAAGERFLIGRRGCMVHLDPRTYGRIQPVISAVDTAVPPALRY